MKTYKRTSSCRLSLVFMVFAFVLSKSIETELEGDEVNDIERAKRDASCLQLRFRRIDGSCNNVVNPSWGQTGSPYLRFLSSDYADGHTEMRRSKLGGELPGARLVSLNMVKDINNEHPVISHMLMQWGQLINHDISKKRSKEVTCCDDGMTVRSDDPNCVPILLPSDDPTFRKRCLSFSRSDFVMNNGRREQINDVTSFVDASPVYGSRENIARSLRSFNGGKLKSLSKPFGKELLPTMRSDPNSFSSGDSRTNMLPSLVIVHVLLLREHNRLAENLAKLNPHWNDEILYQEARRIVSALVQQITYREFLPLVLGSGNMRPIALENNGFFENYNPDLNPTISNAFAVAAYRFGHSLVQSHLKRKSSIMFCRIIFSTVLLCWLFAKHEFRKVGLENPKTNFSTPESVKYNDVFQIDETKSNKVDENATKTAGVSSEGAAQRRPPSLKRIVEAEISNSDFRLNGILYSNDDIDYVKSSICKRANSVRGKKNRTWDKNNNILLMNYPHPVYVEAIGSLRKDILNIKDELSSLVQRIHSVVNEFNSTKKKCIKLKYQWRLDGRCYKDESRRGCDFSCPDSLYPPTTPKTPPGRSSSPLRLSKGPSDTGCAVQLSGPDYIDLGEWAGSCVGQPERCTGGLSLTVWLRLRLRPGGNGSLVAGGDPTPPGRGFALIAARRHGSERVFVTLRDATHVWNAEGTLEGHERWHHLAFTWSRNHGLKLFVNGKAITRHRSVARETSHPSPRSRLLVGTEPGTRPAFDGAFYVANLGLHLSHLHPRDIQTIYYEENEMNSIGN